MSDQYVNDLFAKRQQAWEAQKALLDLAVEESRDLTPEEQEQVAKTDAAIDGYAAEEKRYLSRLELVKAADALRAEMAPKIEEARAERREPTNRELLVAIIKGERRDAEFIVPVNFDSHFGGEVRALQSAGGSAIDTTFIERLTVYERDIAPMLGVATVLNTPRGEDITLPRLTADPSLGGTVTAEAAGITEADPTLSSVTLNSYKYAGITLWSRELDTDNVINLEDVLARSLAREVAADIGVDLTTGNGSAKPNGIVAAAANGGTAGGTSTGQATDTFVSAIDLIDLFYGRATGYRTAGIWMASTTGVSKMRKFRDANGQFLWVDLGPAGVPQFLGRPVVENPAMAAVASASKSFLFGDLNQYYIRRLPVRVETSSEYKFSSDQLAIKVVERIDGDLVDTAAVAYLVSANT